MARRLVPGGLRAQLALSIAVVTVLAVAASFLAVYAGTSSRLQSQIDSQLDTQLAEWRQLTRGSDTRMPAGLGRTAARFIAGQRYHAESLVIVVQINGAPTVTNHDEVLAAEGGRGRGSGATGLLNAPIGLTTATVAEAGSMRVLSTPIDAGGRRIGTLRLANPLRSVQRAQSSLTRTFVIVGAIALLVAIAAGLGLASLIAAPLRRMTRVAAAVNAGDLSIRAGGTARAGRASPRGEVAVLSDAFDHMLDRLERSFHRQRDFVSDASHELRTPLTALRAQAELLDLEPDAEHRHEDTQFLLKRVDELDRLVGDMLTLASVEAGQLVEPRPIELGEFFEDVGRDLPLFGEREFELRPVNGTLFADPDRLTQVLRNLVRNAVTHTQPDDRVSVAARGLDHHLEITVSDTGPGIPPDQLEQIFERFHRLDGGRSRDTGGSGLGLAIARAIVEAHGGSIRAESGPGQGATFRIDLPGYRPAANAARRQREPAKR